MRPNCCFCCADINSNWKYFIKPKRITMVMVTKQKTKKLAGCGDKSNISLSRMRCLKKTMVKNRHAPNTWVRTRRSVVCLAHEGLYCEIMILNIRPSNTKPGSRTDAGMSLIRRLSPQFWLGLKRFKETRSSTETKNISELEAFTH